MCDCQRAHQRSLAMACAQLSLFQPGRSYHIPVGTTVNGNTIASRFIDGPTQPCAAAINSFLILRFSTSQPFPSAHVSFDPLFFYYQMFTPSVSACPRGEVGAVPRSQRPSSVGWNTTVPKTKPSISPVLRQSVTTVISFVISFSKAPASHLQFSSHFCSLYRAKDEGFMK
jgi:hypothetical protein